MYLLKPSFAGGELSPALYGRTDISKYDIGAAKLKNFLVLRYGGVANRAGTRFVAATANNKKAVLLPFKYSTDQNYVVEITAGSTRVYYGGELVTDSTGSPVSVANDFTEDELPLIKYTQSADVLFLVHPNHAPQTLTRYAHTDWRMEAMDLSDGPYDDVNTTDITITPSATTGTITLTASGSLFTSDCVGQRMKIGHTVGSDYVKGVPGTDTLEVSCVPGGTVYVESFGFWDGNFTLEEYIDGTWTSIRSQEGNRTQNYNYTQENDSTSIKKYRITTTEFNIDVWDDENEKQRGYVTLQVFSQDYYGHVEITAVASATSATAKVLTELGSTAATKDFALSAWSAEKGYPYCVGFFEDRLVFAGSLSKPQTFWTSKTGDYYNFGTSILTEDNDAITATLNGGEMNGIKALVAFGEMIILTAGGEYKVTGGNEPLTGTNVRSQPQEYRGISDVLPVIVGSRIIFLQQQGDIIRDLAYNYETDNYTGDDINLLAQHLFERHKIISMAYQQIPNSIIWCVRDDGLLLGLTYLKEQDVFAWHQHETSGGKFIDVCCIAGDMEDQLWCVVERDGKYFVEMMAERDASTDPADQFFVDSGVTFTGDGLQNLTGLDHLEGQQVNILADGNVLPPQTVKDGSIYLYHPYNKVQVGLPIDAEVQTLPLEFNGQDGSYLSRKKRVAQMVILFKESRGGVFGTSEDKLDEIKWRSNENWNTAIELYTGKQKIVIPQATWDDTLKVIIRQTDPLPMTVLSLVPEIEA